MNKLRSLYQDWSKAYSTLEKLITLPMVRAMRDEEACREMGLSERKTIEYLIKREQDEVYDTMAYNDSIALRFQVFAKLSIKLLKAYTSEKYQVSLHDKKALFSFCLQHQLINSQEHDKLCCLSKISNPLEHNQRLYMSLTRTFHKIIHRVSTPRLKAYANLNALEAKPTEANYVSHTDRRV